MSTVILRRSAEDSVSPDEAAELVASLHVAVLHRSGRTMLVDVADEAGVQEIRGTLPGWIVSPQGESIQVPDTRLKVRSSG